MSYRALAYQQSSMLTAAPGDVLLALFDGAVRFVNVAKLAIERKDYAKKADAIARASAILEELTASLDHKRAPLLCGQLASLYSYFMRQIYRANAELNPVHLHEVERHLSRLRDTWQIAVVKARQEGQRV